MYAPAANPRTIRAHALSRSNAGLKCVDTLMHRSTEEYAAYLLISTCSGIQPARTLKGESGVGDCRGTRIERGPLTGGRCSSSCGRSERTTCEESRDARAREVIPSHQLHILTRRRTGCESVRVYGGGAGELTAFSRSAGHSGRGAPARVRAERQRGAPLGWNGRASSITGLRTGWVNGGEARQCMRRSYQSRWPSDDNRHGRLNLWQVKRATGICDQRRWGVQRKRGRTRRGAPFTRAYRVYWPAGARHGVPTSGAGSCG